MQSLITLLRLGVGGLLLDPRAFQAQRESPQGLTRGLLLVLLIGLAVGVAGLVGELLQGLAEPEPQAVVTTIYRGLREMPWFLEFSERDPTFARDFDATFQQAAQGGIGRGGLLSGPIQLITSPLGALIGWLLFGAFAHLAARALGGSGPFSQTLSTTALSSGASLLALVRVVPFTEIIPLTQGLCTLLLGLLACYVAIRSTHGLTPWRAFWATLLGPLLLLVLSGGLCCAIFVLFSSAISAIGA